MSRGGLDPLRILYIAMQMNFTRIDAWYRMKPGEIMTLWMYHRDFNGWNKKDKSGDLV